MDIIKIETIEYQIVMNNDESKLLLDYLDYLFASKKSIELKTYKGILDNFYEIVSQIQNKSIPIHQPGGRMVKPKQIEIRIKQDILVLLHYSTIYNNRETNQNSSIDIILKNIFSVLPKHLMVFTYPIERIK